jgi:hypothetical protein
MNNSVKQFHRSPVTFGGYVERTKGKSLIFPANVGKMLFREIVPVPNNDGSRPPSIQGHFTSGAGR